MVLKSLDGRRAPGGPGIEPRWTHGSKAAVGTAYSTSSHVLSHTRAIARRKRKARGKYAIKVT